jgi:hypothetical protein
MNSMELESRLSKLEQSLKRYRLITGALALSLIGLAGLAAASGPVSQVVRAHEFIVVDESGKETIRLFTGTHGGVLDLRNKDGYAAFEAGAAPTGAKVAIGDGKGTELMVFSTDQNGGQMMLSDKAGHKDVIKATGGRAK